MTVKKASQVPRFWRTILLLTIWSKLHGGVWRVAHDVDRPMGPNLPIGTSSGYSATRENVTTEYHTDCHRGLLDPPVLPL